MKKKISVYTPCFNEQDNVKVCYNEVKELFDTKLKDYDYEHIFGDNFSSDSTMEELKKIAKIDKNIKILSYSANFGAFNSIYYGTISSSGDASICLACDLQDPPNKIVDMVAMWEKGYDVVYGKKIKREEKLLITLIRNVYYRLVNKLSRHNIPENVTEFSLIDKKVVEALRLFDDNYPYLRGMIAACGFKTAYVEYTWKKRKYGKSTSSIADLMNDGINGLISYSNIPLRISLFLGMIISLISLVYAFYSFLTALFLPKAAAPGISLIITALFFFFGIIIFFIGILGEYIGAIHSQVRKKPAVIVREKINFD